MGGFQILNEEMCSVLDYAPGVLRGFSTGAHVYDYCTPYVMGKWGICQDW